jgi:hypothetical protein
MLCNLSSNIEYFFSSPTKQAIFNWATPSKGQAMVLFQSSYIQK